MERTVRVVARAAGAATVAVGAAAATRAAWSGMAGWGATFEEAQLRLPGDELVDRPRYRTTHAVTVHEPAAAVWPWLVQLGQGRGGMYSYDWLENLLGLDMHSAGRIRPDLQGLAVGDEVRLVPEGTEPDLRFVVVRLEPPHVLVLGPAGTRQEAFDRGLPYPVWTFRLFEEGPLTTRLVVRFQSDFVPTVAGRLANKYALAPVHFVMERKMLLGIRDRAEAAGSPPGPAGPAPG